MAVVLTHLVHFPVPLHDEVAIQLRKDSALFVFVAQALDPLLELFDASPTEVRIEGRGATRALLEQAHQYLSAPEYDSLVYRLESAHAAVEEARRRVRLNEWDEKGREQLGLPYWYDNMITCISRFGASS